MRIAYFLFALYFSVIANINQFSDYPNEEHKLLKKHQAKSIDIYIQFE